MATRIRIKSNDAVRLSGLYFIIDGMIHIDGTSGEVKHNSHINFFRSLMEYIPELKEKYSTYSYLEFPRGMIMRDPTSNKIIMSGPDNLSEKQIKKILHEFKYNSNASYEFEYDEHYTLKYIVSTIRKKLKKRYSKDMVDLEIMEVEEFFTNQMKMFN